MVKKILPIIITIIIVGGGSFWGGIKYGESRSSLENLPGGNFQNMDGINRLLGNASGTIDRTQSGFLNGEIISKDEQSITLKTADGSSKIIFFSSSTTISEMAEGTMADLEVGEQVMASGKQNSDGSYTAKTIQIFPR